MPSFLFVGIAGLFQALILRRHRVLLQSCFRFVLSELLGGVRLGGRCVFFIFVWYHSWLTQYSLKESIRLFILFVLDIAEWIVALILLDFAI